MFYYLLQKELIGAGSMIEIIVTRFDSKADRDVAFDTVASLLLPDGAVLTEDSELGFVEFLKKVNEDLVKATSKPFRVLARIQTKEISDEISKVNSSLYNQLGI